MTIRTTSTLLFTGPSSQLDQEEYNDLKKVMANGLHAHILTAILPCPSVFSRAPIYFYTPGDTHVPACPGVSRHARHTDTAALAVRVLSS